LSPVDEGAGEAAALFAGLADIVYATEDSDEVITKLCAAAPVLVPGCDHASVMMRRGNDDYYTCAASDDLARRIDEAEQVLREGPCFDAITEEAAHLDADLRDGSPWPELAAWVLEHTPVRGALGYRLVIEERKVGALNLFSDTAGALNGRSADQSAIFAAFASVAIQASVHRESAQTLRRGLASNREIGKAVGLLMAFYKISDEEAFAKLRKASQDMNMKLADVAGEVLDHHRAR
jgi:GAF domain-containing protein